MFQMSYFKDIDTKNAISNISRYKYELEEHTYFYLSLAVE